MYAATVLTDASFNHTSKVGAYGYWIASDRGSFGGGSHFKTLIKDANIGEMRAIINALYIGLKHNVIVPKDLLLVQTDSLTAIDRLRFYPDNFKRRREDFKSAYNIYQDLVRSNELRINFKHVKAHTNKQDTRSIANKMCDKRAGEAMRLAHKYFIENGTLPK